MSSNRGWLHEVSLNRGSFTSAGKVPKDHVATKKMCSSAFINLFSHTARAIGLISPAII